MLLFQAGALSSETDILFPSETDLPKLTRLPSQNKPTNKHTGRECKLDRVFLPQVESKPPRAILFWRQFGSQSSKGGRGGRRGEERKIHNKIAQILKGKTTPSILFFSIILSAIALEKREKRDHPHEHRIFLSLSLHSSTNYHSGQ